MNKRITAAVLAAALTLSVTAFTGCNDSKDNGSSKAAENSASASNASTDNSSQSEGALEKTSFNLEHWKRQASI